MPNIVLGPAILGKLRYDLCMILSDLDRFGRLAKDSDLQSMFRFVHPMNDGIVMLDHFSKRRIPTPNHFAILQMLSHLANMLAQGGSDFRISGLSQRNIAILGEFH